LEEDNEQKRRLQQSSSFKTKIAITQPNTTISVNHTVSVLKDMCMALVEIIRFGADELLPFKQKSA